MFGEISRCQNSWPLCFARNRCVSGLTYFPNLQRCGQVSKGTVSFRNVAAACKTSFWTDMARKLFWGGLFRRHRQPFHQLVVFRDG